MTNGLHLRLKKWQAALAEYEKTGSLLMGMQDTRPSLVARQLLGVGTA